MTDFSKGAKQRMDTKDYFANLDNYDKECLIYELVDFLICDSNRLHELILEARQRANNLARGRGDLPYPYMAENIYDGAFDEHPAMKHYFNHHRF